MKKILIIAGEASSDMHAADLVRNIKALDKNISFIGLGGDRMKEAGVEIMENIVRMAFIGPGGILKNYAALKKAYTSICDYIYKNSLDCAILIDYAEFNLRVARHLKSRGVKVIYYISPQVWAWGAWRIKTIKRVVDKMLVLFGFEEKLYKEHGIDVTFVGHPLLDSVKIRHSKEDIIKNLGIGHNAKIVGILPGSRKNEIKYILPVMLDSCSAVLKELKDKEISFILPLAPSIDEDYVKSFIEKTSLNIKIVKDGRYDAISICDCAMVTSGTATLETALLGVPMAILYKTNFLTYIATRSVIRLPYIGLVNVIAGERIVPEFLQYEARPLRIAEYMVRLLDDGALSRSMKERFIRIKNSLGEPGASKRAAGEVIKFLA